MMECLRIQIRWRHYLSYLFYKETVHFSLGLKIRLGLLFYEHEISIYSFIYLYAIKSIYSINYIELGKNGVRNKFQLLRHLNDL